MVIRGRSRNEFRRHWQTDGESRDKVVEVVENRLNGFFFGVWVPSRVEPAAQQQRKESGVDSRQPTWFSRSSRLRYESF